MWCGQRRMCILTFSFSFLLFLLFFFFSSFSSLLFLLFFFFSSFSSLLFLLFFLSSSFSHLLSITEGYSDLLKFYTMIRDMFVGGNVGGVLICVTKPKGW